MTESGTSKRRGTFVGEVIANDRICDEHYRLALAMENFPPTRPGQFVQLQCRGLEEQLGAVEAYWPQGAPPKLTQGELVGSEALLRRPFSLAGRRDEGRRVVLEIIHRTVGIGTHWLAGAGPGMRLSVLGPLGNAFAIFPDRPLAALIGWGVGIPPMLYHAEALAAAGKCVVAFNGARSANLLPLTLAPGEAVSPDGKVTPCVEEFARVNAAAAIATDDGSLGFAGTVTEAFRNWLNAHVRDAAQLAVYSCGPEPMLRAVADLCVSRGIVCQLALERRMACGMGTCQSCICKTRADNDRGWEFKLVCTDGSVFNASELVWD